jgi:hypothetical protein
VEDEFTKIAELVRQANTAGQEAAVLESQPVQLTWLLVSSTMLVTGNISSIVQVWHWNPTRIHIYIQITSASTRMCFTVEPEYA